MMKLSLLSLGTALLVGVAGLALNAGTVLPDTQKLQPVPGKILIGVFDPSVANGLTEFERAIGKKPAVINSYQAWDGPTAEFDAKWSQWVASLADRGQVLMITWEPWKSGDDFDQPKYRMSRIAAGRHDAYLKRWFAAVRDTKKPVFVRVAHEMNGFWYPWGDHVNDPRDYRRAWRHVVNLSRRTGATNITWVWTPNENRRNSELDRFYPGGKYVDWVGVSGFNWAGPQKNWAGYRRFDKVFGGTLTWLKKYRKPIMIAEMGTIEDTNQPRQMTKAAWITDAFASAKEEKTPLALIVWHNDIFREEYDWRASASAADVAATKRALADPIFTSSFSKSPRSTFTWLKR